MLDLKSLDTDLIKRKLIYQFCLSPRIKIIQVPKIHMMVLFTSTIKFTQDLMSWQEELSRLYTV